MTRIDLPLGDIGAQHDVVLPASFALREQLVEALGRAHASGSAIVMLSWICAALGLCTRVGRHSGVVLAPDHDMLRFGRDTLDWLQPRCGISPIGAVGPTLIEYLMASRAPSKAEVEAATGPFGERKEGAGSPSTG